MDAIKTATGIIAGAFALFFQSLGGKRAATLIAILFLPLAVFSAQKSSPDSAALTIGGALLLACAGVYALWRTRFYTVSAPEDDTLTKVATWTAIVGGFAVTALVFVCMAMVLLIMSAVMGAMGGGLSR